MSETIVIVGFGSGTSSAVAERFGSGGFPVALVGRNEARLKAGVEALKAKGMIAGAFPADASDPSAVRGAIGSARSHLGRIGVLHWNASSGHALGDLLDVDPAQVIRTFDLAVSGLLAAVQAALPDLKAASDGAVLVTNGAFGDRDPRADAYAVALGAAGVGLGNAAKAKLVGLLAARLRDEGVFVGEVTIAGVVRGTGAAVAGMSVIEPSMISDAFWTLYRARRDNRMRVG